LPEIRDKRCIHKGFDIAHKDLTSRVPHPSHI
jgi:hypothetical protein